MGLLDDAIREHLELKRLHGADPGHVAREEQDALGPVPRNGGSESDRGADEDASEAILEREPVEASQETTELDMSTVLDEDTSAAAAVPPASPGVDAGTSGDSLEWEMPSERGEQAQEPEVEDVLEATPDFLRETPEQERLWFEQQPPRDFDFDK